MSEFTDAFKAMALREFFLEPGPAQEFQAARFLSWLGGKSAWPLSRVVGARLGVPAGAVEVAIRAITGERFTALPGRSASDILAAFRSPDDNCCSCCRSTLCYAVTGSREWAFGALRVAASKHDDWARHPQLYGLTHDVSSDHNKALPELEKGQAAEPMADVRSRIGEAVELCQATRSSPSTGKTGAGPTSLPPHLPEVVRLLLEQIGEAERQASELPSSE
jgi:hypothetical protein